MEKKKNGRTIRFVVDYSTSKLREIRLASGENTPAQRPVDVPVLSLSERARGMLLDVYGGEYPALVMDRWTTGLSVPRFVCDVKADEGKALIHAVEVYLEAWAQRLQAEKKG